MNKAASGKPAKQNYFSKKTASKNKKITAKQSLAVKKQAVLNNFSQIGKHLNYRNHKDGSLRLFDKSADTGIAVKRSHEGYNHFACWYVTDNGKIKKDYPLKEKNIALSKGISLYLDKVTDELLKKKGGGKND